MLNVCLAEDKNVTMWYHSKVANKGMTNAKKSTLLTQKLISTRMPSIRRSIAKRGMMPTKTMRCRSRLSKMKSLHPKNFLPLRRARMMWRSRPRTSRSVEWVTKVYAGTNAIEIFGQCLGKVEDTLKCS